MEFAQKNFSEVDVPIAPIFQGPHYDIGEVYGEHNPGLPQKVCSDFFLYRLSPAYYPNLQ